MWQRPPDRKMLDGIEQPDLAIREGNYKLLINTDASGLQLYDIFEDEEESTDISDKHPKIVKALSDKVLKWHGSMR